MNTETKLDYVFGPSDGCLPPTREPKTIKHDGHVGFRDMSVTFRENTQTVTVRKDYVDLDFTLADFLNLTEQAFWYFDEVVSREVK